MRRNISGVRRALAVAALAAAAVLATPAIATAAPVSAVNGIVRVANFTTAPTPTISGTVKVGQILTAVPGTWKPAPSAFKYQWQRNGANISGATARTYKLGWKDGGKSIRVKVTAVRSGYTSLSKTSAAKSVPIDAAAWARGTYGTFAAVTVSGSGDKTIALPAGAQSGIVAFTHSTGTYDYVYGSIVNGAGDLVDTFDFADELAPSGTWGYGLDKYSRGGTKLKVSASGSWKLTIKPVYTAGALASGVSKSGKGPTVLLYSGAKRTLSASFSVPGATSGYNSVYQYYPSSYSNMDYDVLFGGMGTKYSASAALNPGPTLLEVNADQNWTLLTK